MRIASILSSVVMDIRDVAQAASPPHSDLRERLAAAVLLTVLVDIIAIIAIYLIERGQPGGDIDTLWDAVFFTTSQMVTLSSSFANPVTTAGQVLCLFIDIYAITIVSTIAGMFGAFYYHRSVIRHGAPGHDGEKPDGKDDHDPSDTRSR